MEVTIVYGFMALAILIFVIFDLFKIRITVGYYPFNRHAMATYAPYTVVRIILVAAIYWLTVFIPNIFGISIQPTWQPFLPLISAIISPFLYLVLFSLLGTRIIVNAPGLGEEVDKYLENVKEEVRIWGKNNDIKKFDSVRLARIQHCFCGQIAEYGVRVDDCLRNLEEIQQDIERIPLSSTADQIYIKRSIIDAYLAWIHEKMKDAPISYLNVLRACRP